ncbi:glutathione S-transferase [Lojkania enalia]|uniref:Glutathione S-transferase n=1 Tax=Lojkania enalia TaxID=147567 RepID=A0A9P4NBY9_9PLEO|nr:glutathione S-transferase [Didymosphaeria enalia]
MSPFATLHTLSTILHARVTKSLAVANLNKLTLEIPSDFVYGVTNKSPSYLAKFPHGKIPALETPSGFYLSESTAIAQYLAESGPYKDQLLGRTVEERALVQMWISLADTSIFIDAGPIISQVTGRGSYASGFLVDKEEQFMRAVKRVEVHLAQEGKVWLVRDDEFSLADLSVASALYWPLKFFMDGKCREQIPNVMKWWERLLSIEEVKKGFEGPVELCEVRPPFDGSLLQARKD